MKKRLLSIVILFSLVLSSFTVSAEPACLEHEWETTDKYVSTSYHSHYVLPEAQTCYYYIQFTHYTYTCVACGEVDHATSFGTEGGHDFWSCTH